MPNCKLGAMILTLFLSLFIPLGLAQTDEDYRLEDYISRFQYKPLNRPAKNVALYNLGLTLFYDTDLSGKGNIGCFSCHSQPGFGGDSLPLGVGEGASGVGKKRVQAQGALLARHTPNIYNVGQNVPTFFWDGRVALNNFGGWRSPEPKLNGPNPELKEIAETLESPLALQALFPLSNPLEMLGKESKLTNVEAWDQVMKKIFAGKNRLSYERLFKAAFPGIKTYNIGHVGNALAEAQRHHFSSVDTPWDRYLRGNKNALSMKMKRGVLVFMGKGQCIMCHVREQLSSFGFQNIGVPQIGPGSSAGDDKGLFDTTKKPEDMYKFRVSPLRNVGVTAPYMHSGVFKTLWEVIDHYNDPIASLRNFRWNPRDPRYRDSLNLDTNSVRNDNRERLLSNSLPRSLALTKEEREDLYCFLKVGLTDYSLHKHLEGVENEVPDCSPTYR